MRDFTGPTHVDPHPVFDRWYAAGGVGSGRGSSPAYTSMYRKLLQALLRTYDVRSVLDWGCGDWQSSRLIDWGGIDYLGVDVVPQLVRRLAVEHGDAHVRFLLVDPERPEEPFERPPCERFDLVVCKDVLQHLPNADAVRLVELFGRIGRRVLLVNDRAPRAEQNNGETALGGFRYVDPARPPFALPGRVVLELSEGGDGKSAFLHIPGQPAHESSGNPIWSPTVIDVLRAYREQQTAEERQAWGPSVLRALVSHDAWRVPAHWARRRWPARSCCETPVEGGSEGRPAPASSFWVFTDEGAAREAARAGWAVGSAMAVVPGVELFGALGPEITDLRVNPGASAERTWSLGRSTLDGMVRWVEAIELETALASEAPDLDARLAAYASFLVVAEGQEQTPGVVRVDGRVYLPAFTAPDRARAFAVGMGKLGVTVLGGAELLARAAGQSIDGVVLDAGSPSSYLLSLDRCRALAGAV